MPFFSSNAFKWFLALATGFCGGLIIAATHNNSQVWDYLRDGLIGMAPTIAALNVTLKKQLGIETPAPTPPDKSKSTAA